MCVQTALPEPSRVKDLAKGWVFVGVQVATRVGTKVDMGMCGTGPVAADPRSRSPQGIGLPRGEHEAGPVMDPHRAVTI